MPGLSKVGPEPEAMRAVANSPYGQDLCPGALILIEADEIFSDRLNVAFRKFRQLGLDLAHSAR